MQCILIYLNSKSKKVRVQYSRRFMREDPLIRLQILADALNQLDEKYYETIPTAFGEMEVLHDTSLPKPSWHLSHQQV